MIDGPVTIRQLVSGYCVGGHLDLPLAEWFAVCLVAREAGGSKPVWGRLTKNDLRVKF